MDVKKQVLGSLRSMLDDRLASRIGKREESPEMGEGEVGRGSEKDVYPDPDANMEGGIPQAGAPEKEMRGHQEYEFTDAEREDLRKLYSHGE